MTEVRAGVLLLATPALRDPNFVESVVLMLDVTDDGALGVVLNHPTSVAVAEVLEPWAEVVAEPEVLFRGGPVEADSALAVALRQGDRRGVPGFREVLGRLSLVDLDAPVDVVAPEIAGLRIFAGYSGWGAGQLQAEVEAGSWYVVPGEVVDVFRADTTGLWRAVLRRQPGEVAWVSTRPADPDLN